MEYKPWMDYVTVDDMPNDDMKFIAIFAGLKSALALLFSSPGISVSIPKISFKKAKERYVLKEYDGRKFTINRLAVECELSQRQIYLILEKARKKNKNTQKPS